MKKISRSILVGAITMMMILGMAVHSNAGSSAQMPQFTLKRAVDGIEVDSKKYEGKVLLISFFATWCPPCIEEIPTFMDLQKTYGEDKFSIIALSVDQGGPATVAKLVKKKKINYPVLMADSETMQNFGGVYGVPVSFLVNAKGNVVKKYPGYVPKSTLTKDIKSIMD